jgi:hypothetical protein
MNLAALARQRASGGLRSDLVCRTSHRPGNPRQDELSWAVRAGHYIPLLPAMRSGPPTVTIAIN